MGFDLCVLWQAVSLINLKMKRMLAFEKRYLRRNSTSVISTCHGQNLMVCSFSHVFFSFLCLPEWTNAMSAAILFRAND